MNEHNANLKTGWERENRAHFDEITWNYDRIRPEYPSELFNDIFRYVRTDTPRRALEIGAGTGKATVPFLDAGYDVTAVEIGEKMSAFLKDRFIGYDNFRVYTAAFEDAVLEEGSFDLVYAATAFHWVNAETGCPKVYRLLKNGGAFALFRYITVPADGDELYEEIQALYEKYYRPYSRPVRKTYEEYMEPSELKKRFGVEDLRHYGFCDISIKLYSRTRIFDADEYIALLDTFSDHRSLPESDRTALYSGIRETILDHGNRHRVDYVFLLYMGRKEL